MFGRGWLPRVVAVATIAGFLVVGSFLGASARPARVPAHRTGAPASLTGDPVIAAAGDIACDPRAGAFKNGNGNGKQCMQMATSNLLVTGGFTAVLPLGDTQYDCGGASAYAASYAPSWGRVAGITYPAIGNHEYQRSGGTNCSRTDPSIGYRNYFLGAGAPQVLGPNNGYYYSYDIGAWHLIALNANCHVVACKPHSAQETWLQQDLLAHPNTCVLAYWHQPRFAAGNGQVASDKSVSPLWNDLAAARADVVLNGHRHYYERLGKMDVNGAASPTGLRQWIVGTGGEGHANHIDTVWPTNEVFDASHFGILALTLHPTSYDWSFVAIDGSILDTGSDTCSA